MAQINVRIDDDVKRDAEENLMRLRKAAEDANCGSVSLKAHEFNGDK